MNPTYYLLDVFTDELFGGNQLAVIPDASHINPDLFQKIAGEFNLSETVFLFPPDKLGDGYSMRIFTPKVELPTAGHPTIGTAYYLASQNEGVLEIELIQKVGKIKVTIDYENDKVGTINMFQPLPTFGQLFENRSEIANMVSLEESDLDNLPIQAISCGNEFLFIPVKSVQTLSRAKVDTAKWEQMRDSFGKTELYVFSINKVEGGQVRGRMFAPGIGITEDPATGSANGPLACYLNRYTELTFPITSLQGFEMGRPSHLFLDVKKDENGEINEVKVGGKSKFVGKGELFLNRE
ncbi:PhzF family phenazine biosynthesis protein [Marinoscillum sp. MHG1-6]|uniref:PhzF family phenazine biosynthesis protein n=1 Tax=Marinoscillum sp. MHG1-6 TaxID=2959627 RepID=UPI002157F1F4|nr:PhzF family phenazine biosynthesis protein [Marinoscillum sp. MHG1-6]